jgi:hypothetical protein
MTWPCVKALDAVAVCALLGKQCWIFSAKDVEATVDVAELCAVSSSKRNSEVDAVMDQVRLKCPGVEVGNYAQFSKFAMEKNCASRGLSTYSSSSSSSQSSSFWLSPFAW